MTKFLIFYLTSCQPGFLLVPAIKEFFLFKEPYHPLVREIWIISGLFMLANPALSTIVATTLFTTFLCFSLIDEQDS